MSLARLKLTLPTIELGAVLLRPWRLADAPALVAAWSDPTITAEAEPPRDRSVLGAERWIEGAAERCRAGLAVDLVVADGDDDRVLGEVGLSSVDPRRGACLVGWWTAAGERGRGIATVAVSGFADWALGPAGLEVMVAEIGAANEASWRVAEQCGFEVLRPPTAEQAGVVARRRKNSA